MNSHVACAVAHFDARGAEIGVTCGNELRQQLKRFGRGRSMERIR